MNTFQYTLFIAFSILAIMMVLDNNVGAYLTLIFKIMKVNVERFFWMLKYHPSNFLTTFVRNRQYDKIAKELEKEFNSK